VSKIDPPGTDAASDLDPSEIDAAIEAIGDPERMRAAQDLVARTAPALQRVLAQALADGGWFDTAHDAAVTDAIGVEDPGERLRAVKTLFAEEARLSMLVGVAVGFELARELRYRGLDPEHPEQTDDHGSVGP
jgi:hypothetical protein